MSETDEFRASFHAMKEQMTPDPELVSRVQAALDAEPVSDVAPAVPDRRPVAKPTAAASPVSPRQKTHRSGRLTRPLSLLGGGVVAAGLAAVMFVSGLGQTTPVPVNPWPAPIVVTPAPNQAGGDVPASGTTTAAAQADPAAYAKVYQALTTAAQSGYGTTFGVSQESNGSVVPFSGQVVIPDNSQAATYTGANGSLVSGSGTNVQVAGIDEGDFVKTDGSYLYVAHGRQVSVVTASGADSHVVAVIDVSGLTSGDEVLAGPVADMMIDGSTLIVLTHAFSADTTSWSRNQGTYIGLEATSLKAAFYNIADPANPKFLSVVSQSGSYVDSRLSNGLLYLVSRYSVTPDGVNPSQPVTFVPAVGDGGTPVPLTPGDIYIMPYVQQPSYSVVTAIDLASRTVVGDQAVLGGADTVYMSPDNLYLASAMWPTYDGTTTQGPAVTIPGTNQRYADATTTIVRIAVKGGSLAVAAQTALAGTLTDQFALDELDGNLRVATTWQDTSNNGYRQNSALWVLGPDLKVVSSIPKLASDESVQSVRFDGTIAYVVTFKQMDPLFAIDLADPAKPEIRSALKIPGFSSYLQPFGDDRLLGIGTDVSTDGQWNGLKLSMFDVSDPYQVQELSTIRVKGDATEASDNHHAAFVDPELGLIGFPVTTWNYASDGTFQGMSWTYDMYHWTGSTFTLTKVIDLVGSDQAASQLAMTDPSTRGVQLGSDFYVATSGFVGVYDMAGYAQLTKVTLS